MQPYVPYSSNPFEEPLCYRLIVDNKHDSNYYQLFIKNMIAAIHYQDFQLAHSRGEGFTQTDLYRKFTQGNLQIELENSHSFSPIHYFCELELQALSHEQLPEAKAYCKFLKDFQPLLKRIDCCVNYVHQSNKVVDIEDYMHQNIGKVPYLDTSSLRDTFRHLEYQLAKILQHQFIAHQEINLLPIDEFSKEITTVHYLLHHEFIDKTTQDQLKSIVYKWVKQLLRHMYFEMDLLGEEKSMFSFLHAFQQGIAYQIDSAETQQISYPKIIFTQPQAFLLFDALAKELTHQAPISFVYRTMQEIDGFIRVRDKEFRAWYNQQNYPTPLHSVTITLAQSSTEERKAYLKLLYTQYGLSSLKV